MSSSNFSKWTYGAQSTKPIITGLTPRLMFAAGGHPVEINGSNFTGTTEVQVNSVSIPFTFNSDTQLTITAPAETAGTSVHTVVTNASGSSTPGISDLLKYVGFIPTWTDGFTTDHFTLGDNAYTVLAGTEGTSFTVDPADLHAHMSTGVTWADQRTYQALPFETTITIFNGPFQTLAFGLADGGLTTVAILASYNFIAGTMSIKTIDPTDGTVVAGTVSYAPPTTATYKLRLKADSSTITVYDGTTSDPGTVITTVSTPSHMVAAIAANVVTPVVIGAN